MAWLYRGDPLGDVLEVGNVLQHYGTCSTCRRAASWTATRRGHVENLDVFDITGRYDTIITISTVEHVGWDPPEPRTPGRSVDRTPGLPAHPTGRMLVTVPTGWNQPLDDWRLTGQQQRPSRSGATATDGY